MLYTTSVNFGCDPELFFTKDGQVIGAEKVIDKVLPSQYNQKAFVLDGVQIELNPRPEPCRANLGNEIRSAFVALREHLKTKQGVSATFNAVINLDRKELDSLGDAARQFGCMPSQNFYDASATVRADASKDLMRSAGGHIHLGIEGTSIYRPTHGIDHRERLVPLMDVLVGLPSVLIDRDPLAAKRRLHYGRAGEYRLPEHGLEYRTLSNYWLRSYQLFSFVMGMSRMACGVLYSTLSCSINLEAELLKSVSLDKVRTAINENDLTLAKQLYKDGVRPFIEGHVEAGNCGLSRRWLPAFDDFIQKIDEHGIEYWFPDDPLEHWCSQPEGHDNGWEAFLSRGYYVSITDTGIAKKRGGTHES